MNAVLTSEKELREAVHDGALSFKCGDCGQVKPVGMKGGTGYGYMPNSDKPVCYECCGKRDLADMEAGKPMTLYLQVSPLSIGGHGSWYRRTSNCTLSNWPGTLKIVGTCRKGAHNIASTRYDVWFTFAGHNWHGVQYGENTQLCRCKVVK